MIAMIAINSLFSGAGHNHNQPPEFGFIQVK
jgi:hypothetical protein